MENYKTNLDDDVRMLEKYGGIDPQNGDYLPFFCRGCDGPLLGHIAEERECQGPKMSAEQREILNDRIRNNEYFDVQLKFLDKRPSEIRCQPCNLIFHNAYRRRQHDKDKHGGKRAEEVSNESLCQELVNKIAENQITNTSNMANILEKIVVAISKKEDETVPRTTQITKAKPPPSWVGQDYERFEKEVKNWEANNKDPPETKYRDFLENLKKEPKVSSHTIGVIIDKTEEASDRTVNKILEVLKSKHGRTKVEKVKDITNEFLGFEMRSGESAEAFLDRTENLITKCIKEKIKDNFEYMIANTMIEKAEKAGKLTKEERVKLQDSIEVEEMNDRVPKSENEVFEKLRKEFKKLKIENNRDEKDEKVDTKNIHYGERKSRFEEWKRFKSNPEYNDYERSGSMPGFWRSKSGNNYRRAPSRTPSRRFDRSGSFRKDKNHVTLAEKVSKIEQSVKNIENILAKKGNETKETLYIKEIRYVKEEKNEMVLDSGAPVATVGDDWLEEYIKEHEIDERKLVKTKSNQKFRFGPSQIYTTKEVTEIPITLKNAKTDEYVKTKIPVYVVEAKNVPLLIGKNIY